MASSTWFLPLNTPLALFASGLGRSRIGPSWPTGLKTLQGGKGSYRVGGGGAVSVKKKKNQRPDTRRRWLRVLATTTTHQRLKKRASLDIAREVRSGGREENMFEPDKPRTLEGSEKIGSLLSAETVAERQVEVRQSLPPG